MTQYNVQKSLGLGFLYTGGTQLISQALNIGTTIVLARLLAPNVFGLLSIALIAANFAYLLTQSGLAVALVQARDVEQQGLTALFWLSLVLGMFVAALFIINANHIAVLFGNVDAAPLLRILALTFPLSSVSSVQKAILRRRLEFKNLGIIDIFAQLTYSIATIPLVLYGWGIWALVYGTLVRSTVDLLLSTGRTRWIPGKFTGFTGTSPFLGFGMNVFATQLLVFFRQNIDNASIGRVLGSEALAFYNVGFQWAMYLPVTRLIPIVTQVAFPIFSRLHSTGGDIRKRYLQVSFLLALLIFPILVLISILANEFIFLLYGANWKPAMAPLQILCLGGGFSIMAAATGSTLKAVGRPDVEMRIELAASILLVIAVIIGIRYGIAGVAWGVTVEQLLFAILLIIATCRTIHLSVRENLRLLSIPIIGAIAMSLALLASANIPIHDQFLRTLLRILIGVISYIMVVWLAGPREVRPLILYIVKNVQAYYTSIQILAWGNKHSGFKKGSR